LAVCSFAAGNKHPLLIEILKPRHFRPGFFMLEKRAVIGYQKLSYQ